MHVLEHVIPFGISWISFVLLDVLGRSRSGMQLQMFSIIHE